MMVSYEYKGVSVRFNLQAEESYGEVLSGEEYMYFSVQGGLEEAKACFRDIVDYFLN